MEVDTLYFGGRLWKADDLWNIVCQSSLQSLAYRKIDPRIQLPDHARRDFKTENDILNALLTIDYFPHKTANGRLADIANHINSIEYTYPVGSFPREYHRLCRVEKMTVDYLVRYMNRWF